MEMENSAPVNKAEPSRGWNDPPMLNSNYSAISTKRNLNKRIAFPVDSSNPANSVATSDFSYDLSSTKIPPNSVICKPASSASASSSEIAEHSALSTNTGTVLVVNSVPSRTIESSTSDDVASLQAVSTLPMLCFTGSEATYSVTPEISSAQHMGSMGSVFLPPPIENFFPLESRESLFKINSVNIESNCPTDIIQSSSVSQTITTNATTTLGLVYNRLNEYWVASTTSFFSFLFSLFPSLESTTSIPPTFVENSVGTDKSFYETKIENTEWNYSDSTVRLSTVRYSSTVTKSTTILNSSTVSMSSVTGSPFVENRIPLVNDMASKETNAVESKLNLNVEPSRGWNDPPWLDNSKRPATTGKRLNKRIAFPMDSPNANLPFNDPTTTPSHNPNLLPPPKAPVVFKSTDSTFASSSTIQYSSVKTNIGTAPVAHNSRIFSVAESSSSKAAESLNVDIPLNASSCKLLDTCSAFETVEDSVVSVSTEATPPVTKSLKADPPSNSATPPVTESLQTDLPSKSAVITPTDINAASLSSKTNENSVNSFSTETIPVTLDSVLFQAAKSSPSSTTESQFTIQSDAVHSEHNHSIFSTSTVPTPDAQDILTSEIESIALNAVLLNPDSSVTMQCTTAANLTMTSITSAQYTIPISSTDQTTFIENPFPFESEKTMNEINNDPGQE